MNESREKRRLTTDHASCVPYLHDYISVRNQVNGVTSFQARTGEAKWRSFPEQASSAGPDGLRFHAQNDMDRQFVSDLFYGIDNNFALCELWYLMCYREMRDKGIWSVNIAAEQRLEDELYGPFTGVPNTPAAIQ